MLVGGNPASTRLNAICPYFTMFPLDFPASILRQHVSPGDRVFDPFCGRGTTAFAARLSDLESTGIDSSPVAVAIAEAKLANTSPDEIADAARNILATSTDVDDMPVGEFWEWAFHGDVLRALNKLRKGLLTNCETDARKALRAIVMGALHGPFTKGKPSYFSNQAPRTYAPKPAYAVKFWRERNLLPVGVDVLEIIRVRANRYFGSQLPQGRGIVTQGDSAEASTFSDIPQNHNWVITSPPYYGMRTYLPDQWLRMWFVGGPPCVHYSMENQIRHTSPELFADQLRRVWRHTGQACVPGARMVIRFGAINDRKADPRQVIALSLEGSGWKTIAIASAGSAAMGRRQAAHFGRTRTTPLEEFDVWCNWPGS